MYVLRACREIVSNIQKSKTDQESAVPQQWSVALTAKGNLAVSVRDEECILQPKFTRFTDRLKELLDKAPMPDTVKNRVAEPWERSTKSPWIFDPLIRWPRLADDLAMKQRPRD